MPNKSVGLGAYRNFDNIGHALGHDGLRFDPHRVEELKRLVHHKLTLILSGRPHAAPLNVFIKPEPHKASKVAEGRYRLISGVALEDAMIDRILFGPLARKVLETAGTTPIMIGNTLFGGMWRKLRASYGSKNLAIDKSGWDWSMQWWLIIFFRELMRLLHPGATPEYWMAVDARLDLLFRDAVFGFRDGTYINQLFPGIMKSGCFITIILNSLCQLALHYAALLDLCVNPLKYRPPKCLGDDTTQDEDDLLSIGYVDALERLGCVVKEAIVHKDLDFAGYKITRNSFLPAYKDKHLFKMVYNSHFPEWLGCMQGLYAYDDDMLQLLRRGCLATGNASLIQSKAFGFGILG